MIVFDASYLVVFLNQNPSPAKDRENKPVSQFKERVEYLTAELNASGEPIGIPAPAMAEVLVRAGKEKARFISILSDRWRFQILAFDARAAIEASELIALIKSSKESDGTWAKVKFDIQIVSIAKAESVSKIYADDRDIENYAKRLKIPVVRICDLPLPSPKEFPRIDTQSIGTQSVLFDLAPPLIQTSQETESRQSAKLEVNTDEVIVTGPEKISTRKSILDDEIETASTRVDSVRRTDEEHTQDETAIVTKQEKGSP